MKQTTGLFLFILLLFPAIGFSQEQAMTGEQVYQKTCFVCHDTGIGGAPKLGDKAAWAPRIKEGMDDMYNSALHGEDAMPAKGGNSALSEAEVKAAVDFMISKSE